MEGGDEGQRTQAQSSEEAQWEDISTVGEDRAAGREAKEAKSSPRGNKRVAGRTNPSPRKSKRGLWLGRKTKLLGREASKKQNNESTGGTMVCGDPNSTQASVKRAGRGQELDTATTLEPRKFAANGPN